MEITTRFFLFVCSRFVLAAAAAAAQNGSRNSTAAFHVGVILDLGTLVGKMGSTSISMAVEDFYAMHGNYTSRIVFHIKDSKSDTIQAASAALDLIENSEVEVIIGPQKSSQAAFVAELGNRSQVPIISFSATSPTLTSCLIPYFVRTTLNDSSQVNSISSIIKAYGWREVVLIYEDTDYGRGVIPNLVDALQGIDTRVPYHSVIPLSATNDQIMEELYRLMTMQTRVFIVHVSSFVGSHLFLNAKEAGMMTGGFVWIMSDGLANIVDSLDPSVIESMQGTLGVKLYVPKSRKLDDFTTRWKRRFQQDHPNDQQAELSIFALWAYDTVWAVAMAAEKIGIKVANFRKPRIVTNSTVLETLGTSMNGPKLLKAILDSRFKGLSGDYNAVPKGWDIPVSGKKLRIGVPVTQGFPLLMNIETDPVTNSTMANGYCIDVFETAIKKLPYSIPYEYIPFKTIQGELAGEKIENILSKFVVIVWVFVVLVLTSSYTASLTSMLTVQQLQPTVTDVHELLKHGDYVGYHKGSFVEGLLKQLNFDESKLRAYETTGEYFEALSKGSQNGGVSAIVHEIPYIKLFLAEHCTGFTMIGPIYKTAGFGFVFPKGSPLVLDVSRAILNLTDGDSILQIEKKWFGDQNACLKQRNIISSDNLSFRNFWGLFMITGVVSTCALFIFLLMFLHKNWHELKGIDSNKPFWQRIGSWASYYNNKDMNSYTFRADGPYSTSPATNSKYGDVADPEATTCENSPNQQGFLMTDSDATHYPLVEESSSGEITRVAA
ncbi:hypothetical protein MUK42_00526 [Musa troglodytarum]|uniref:Glutamate receptor n=1 Tax=Musa troglodytarum TaxID=320322 RepID=A0A9E7FDD1_9LILI|nr:hypothetical protein MUK42_00526 [Musa troglodytarum]